MANRKFLIDGILGLAQKLGANPNKFMGTKQNINFLGTGDRGMKGTTFSGKIDENFMDLGFTKNDLVKIIEQDAGYVTAGKLNDVQLNTMYNNLLKIDETFNPPPGPLNVIDLETGTVGLNKEGLESLRETDKIKRFTQGLRTSKTAMSNKIKEGINTLKTKIKAPFNIKAAVDDIEKVERKASEQSFLRTGAADFSDSIQAEGARRAVMRQVMKNNPNFFNLPEETIEQIAAFKDLEKFGSDFHDPLILLRAIVKPTRKELNKIDDVIQQSPFDDIDTISKRVFEYLKIIRPDGFADGGRIGFRSGGIGRLMSEGIKTALKRTRQGYDTPGADFQVLTQSDSYLMSPPNMQMLEKLKIIRRQLVRDIKRKEGGGKYTFGPDPKATKKDLQSLDEYIAELMKKISVEGYYGEGRAAEKALLESDPSLPFSKLVKDRYRSADGGRIGFRSGKTVKGIAELLKLTNKKFGKDTLKTADKIDRPEAAKLRDEFERFNKRSEIYGGPYSDKYNLKRLEDANTQYINVDDMKGIIPDDYNLLVNTPLEQITPAVLRAKYPGIPERLSELIGNDTNLQRKAEAIAAIEQALALRGAGKSADETIAILKSESKTKMSKGGLARILEM